MAIRKIVPNGMPGIIQAKGLHPRIRTVASPEEFVELLANKLVEEALEVQEAVRLSDRASVIVELGDVLEIVDELSAAFILVREYIAEARRAKTDRRGTFSQRLVWEGNEEGPDRDLGDNWERDHVLELVATGRSRELLEAWSDHNQSCAYLTGIIDHVAAEGSSMTAQEFARSLQEEGSK